MAEIKQAKFIDQTGQEKDAVFIGAEKAIYDDSGKRLDQKLEEREKATGLLASDTHGILGSIGAEVPLQTIIDKVAEKIMRELVSNSSLTQTLANYMTTAMMSGEQIDDGNKVPTSALAFAMNQAITQNKNAITQLNSDRLAANTIHSASANDDTGIKNDLYGHWSKLSSGVASLMYRNSAEAWIGLINKYDESTGSILLINSYGQIRIYVHHGTMLHTVFSPS